MNNHTPPYRNPRSIAVHLTAATLLAGAFNLQAQTAPTTTPTPKTAPTTPIIASPTATTGTSTTASTSTKPSTPAADGQLATIEVEGNSPDTSTLPVRPTDSVDGLGNSVLDTPRSVYQVSKDQLKNDPLKQVSDIAEYAPSITNSSGQGIAGAPYIRGYTAEVYQDGFRIGRFLRPFDPNTAYQSLDVVTGPASVNYGPSSKTSGYLDWTTKKPDFDGNHTDIDLTFGQWVSGGQGGHADFSQSVDNTGPLSKTLAYRAVYTQNEADSYYIGGQNNFEHTYEALTWLPTKDISVDWNFEYGNYDYALTRGWNRIDQNLVDNGTYLSGVATPVFKSGTTYYEPAANSPTAANSGYYIVTPNTKTGSISTYTPGAKVATIGGSADPTGTLQGFVLRPGNVTPQQLYGYQGATNPSDPTNLNQVIAEQNAAFVVDSDLTILNKSYYEYDNYNQQTYDGASLQGTISNLFENRTEFHLDENYKTFGLNIEHKSNSGLDLRFLDESVVFNNSNFLLNGYDISGNQLTNMNINNLYGLTTTVPPGNLTGVYQTKAYGKIALAPDYPISGFQYPLSGSVGSANYDSKVAQFGLYTLHELTFDDQWTWNVGVRATGTYVYDKNNVEVPFGGSGYGSSLKDATFAIEPVFSSSLSYKPVSWATLYATYNYTQAINDDSGNSGGGVAYGSNGQISPHALHSDSVLYETGAKFEIIPNQLFASVAGYYQNRQLAPTIVPGLSPIYPEVETHGAEFAINYQPNKNFSTGLNLSWLESSYIHYNPNAGFSSPYGVSDNGITVLSATGSLTNSQYPAADYNIAEPKDRLDAFATYQFDNGIGFKADLWATSQFTMTNNLATIPSEYNVDLSAFYAQPRWRVQVDFLNVTNQQNFEIANSDAGENLTPSEPFAIQGKFTYKF